MTLFYFQYFQLFSLLLALLCRKGLNAFSIGILIPILLVDNATEVLGSNYTYIFHSVDNYFVYNIYYLLSTPLYLYLFAAMLKGDKRENRRLFIAGVVIEIFIIVNYFLIQHESEFDTFTALLVSLTNIILSCLVLTRLAIRKEEESNLLADPYFWINAMILLFSLVSIIVLGLQKYIALNHIQFGGKSLYFALMEAANAALYTGYSGAILLCQMQRSK
jgi:membrane-associated PAP2 superfamily phosphatase